MKKNVFTLLSLMMLSFSFLAQEKINLVIFSEDGDAFFAFVNGIRQNDKPETNVKVTGLSPNVSLRLEFADKALPSLKQAMPCNLCRQATACPTRRSMETGMECN